MRLSGRMDLEGSGHGLNKVVSRNFTGRTEESEDAPRLRFEPCISLIRPSSVTSAPALSALGVCFLLLAWP